MMNFEMAMRLKEMGRLHQHHPVDAKVMREADLVADSVRQAEYHLRLLQLPNEAGFVVVKASGPANGQKIEESWYRYEYKPALNKFFALYRQKTQRQKGRVYREIPKPIQMQLF